MHRSPVVEYLEAIFIIVIVLVVQMGLAWFD